MTIKNHDLCDVDDLTYLGETELAYKTKDADDKIVWLPKSQVEYDKDGKVFTMPEWLAEDKGLI